MGNTVQGWWHASNGYGAHVFGPFTSTFSMMVKRTPRAAANALISAAVPGSCAPNWLHGNATMRRPDAEYFSWRATSSA